MTRDKLLKRLKMFEGTPEKKRVKPINALRRGLNYIELEEDNTKHYDSFFDFEKELLEEEDIPPPSRMIAANASGAQSFFEKATSDNSEQQEAPTNNDSSGPGFVMMEEEPQKQLIIMEEIPDEPELEQVNEIYEKASGFMTDEELEEFVEVLEEEKKPKFEFIQCEFIKKDGNRCKKQAPKGHTICSTHRRMVGNG